MLVIDAGGFLAVEKGDHDVAAAPPICTWTSPPSDRWVPSGRTHGR